MVEKLRVGIIGAGRWAAGAHLPGFARSPLSEIVAICDHDRALAEQRANEFNIPSVYTDYQAMLASADLDIVDICTRGGLGDKNNHEPFSVCRARSG